MARFIINEKVYNTEKMELIGKVKKRIKVSSYVLRTWLGTDYYATKEGNIYRSQKNNWLFVYGDDVNGYTGIAMSESEAKDLLMHSNYEVYSSLFGELEEA